MADGTRFKEWKWCKDMAMMLHEALKIREDINPIIVNPEDYDLPLATRAKRVNNYCKALGARNCILIEIHNNAAGSEDKWMTARGFEVYTTKGETVSDQLATLLYNAASEVFSNSNYFKESYKGEEKKMLRMDFSDGDPDKENNFYVIKQALCAAVLIENFFQDNKKDVELLMSDKGKEKILEVYLKAIEKWKQIKKL